MPSSDLESKLSILADAAKYDASCASSGARRTTPAGGMGNSEGMGICHSYTPDGRCVSLLKILLTNYCVYDCQYCINRISSDVARARFTPEEVVQLTLDFYQRNYIEGLFLSSGVLKNPDYTMEQMVRVGKLLRTEHKFGGYIHLKVVPGASEQLVAEAGKWADRLSANIELPNEEDLARLAPDKKIEQVDTTMGQIKLGVEESMQIRKRGLPRTRFAPAGQTTQMIVGATATSDALVLSSADRLYSTFNLRRIYYSAFSPIPHADARLPSAAPPLVREHRLYQADWLMRFYGFAAWELTTDASPNLSLDFDPKTTWALRHRDFFPLDVNRAPKEALLRVPGLGVQTVQKIVATRRYHVLTLGDLKQLRVSLRRCKPFIVTADYSPPLAEAEDRQVK